ncbi:MAG: beta strand repeat-containing protein, partial [Halobaculum sp.]
MTDYGVTDAAVIGPPAFLDGDDVVEVPYVDNDGNLEVVDASGQTTTFVGANDLGTSPRTGKSKLAVTDWDGDGNPDVVFANGNGDLYRVDADETGSPTQISTNKQVQFVVGAFDVTGDNERDVVYITTSSGLRAVDGETGTDTELSTDTTWGANDQIGFGEPTLRNGTFVSPRVSGGEEPQLQLFDGEGTVEQISDFGVAKTAPTAVDLDGDGRAAYAFVTDQGSLVTTRPNDSFRTVTVGGTGIEVDDDVGLASPVTVRTPAVVSVRDTGNLTVENLTVGNAGTTSPSGEPPGDVANLSFTARNVSVAAAATLPLDPDGAANLTDSGLDVRNTTGGDPVFEARFAYTQADVTETGFDESTGGVGQYDGDTDTWVFLDSTQQAIDDEIGVTVPHNRRGVVAPFVGATEPDETGPTVSVAVVDEVGSAATVNVTSDEPLAALEVNVDGPGPLEAREREAFEEVRLPNGNYSYRTPLSFPAGAVTVELTTATDAAGNAAGAVSNETATVTAMATVDDSGGADFTSIQTAVEQTPPGSVIAVANGTYEESVTVAQNTTLSLASSAVLNGSTVSARAGINVTGDTNLTVVGGTVTNFTVGVAGNATAADVTLRNLTIRETTEYGVDAGAATGNWTLDRTTIRNTTSFGVRAIEADGTWSLVDTTVEDADNTGLNFYGADGSVSLDNVTVRDAGGYGVGASQTTGQWHVGETTVHDTDFSGIYAFNTSENWTITDTVVRETNSAGVYGVSADGDWTITNTTVRHTTTQGVIGSQTTGQWEISNVSVSNASTGIFGVNSTGDWTVRETKVVDTGSVGIWSALADGNWTVRNTTVADTGGEGVLAANVSGSWTVRDVSVSDTTFEGVDGFSSTGNWSLRNVTLTDNRYAGVSGYESTGNWTLRNVTVTDTGGPYGGGVLGHAAEGNWTLSNVSVDNTTHAGVNGSLSTGAWTLREVSVTGTTEAGLDATDTTGAWSLANVTVAHTDTRGITAVGAAGDWTIRDTLVRNTSTAAVVATGVTGTWSVNGSALLG